MASGEDFYVRYYVGHKGKFGHEFLEFEFRPDGGCDSLTRKLRSLLHFFLLYLLQET